MYLKQRTLSGIEWSIGTRITNQILQFIFSVILARLLSPEDFGLIGMILVVTGIAWMLNELGVGAALVQKKEVEDRHLSSIFWLCILSGFIMTCVLFGFAPLIARFYSESQLIPLTMLISFTCLVRSFNIVQRAIFNRTMNFIKLGIIETLTTIIAGSLAITMAYLGFGVWSLAIQLLISSTFSVIIMWIVSDWKPRFFFEIHSVKELIGYSSNLLGFNLFNYWVRNTDNLFIGKILGSLELGIYSRAYSIMLMPLSLVSTAIGNVMFPALSKIQEDKVLVKKIYLNSVGVIALVTFPMMLGLFAVADSFILALLGPKWIKVIPLLKVFSLLGMVQSIGTTVGWIYQSQGRTDWQFKWGIVAGTLLIISIAVGVLLGSVMSVALCYTIMSGVILLYHNFTIPGKLINLSFIEVVINVRGPIVCACLMHLGVYLLGMVLPTNWSPWYKLFAEVSLGSALYIVLIHIFKIESYVILIQLFREEYKRLFGQVNSI